MLYNLRVEEKDQPTETNIFGTRMLLTNGVQIRGKRHLPKDFRPFSSVDELINAKNNMRRPPAGNTPILITKLVEEDTIRISGRLEKNGSLSHDPNIGASSINTATMSLLKKHGSRTI